MTVSHLAPRVELLAKMDVTSICSALAVVVGGASRNDVHLFAYLSSMTNTQTGLSPTSWGYPFVASREGLPFAEALEFILDTMIMKGDLLDGTDGLVLGADLVSRFEVSSMGAAFADRIALIQDVCGLAVFRPLPNIGRALRNEQQLRRAADLAVVRMIDEDQLSSALIDLMVRVRDRLPSDYSPAGPAMLWLDEWERSVG